MLLKCVCSNEFSDGYDYAVVDLDPDLANLLLQRIEMFQMLTAHPAFFISSPAAANSLYEMRFHDCSVQYLNDECTMTDDDSPTVDDIDFGEKEFTQLPDGFEIREDWHARSEGDYMVIRNQGVTEPRFEVCWVCRPKHTSDHVETADLDLETIKIAAKGQNL
jgi:hypothetical protein